MMIFRVSFYLFISICLLAACDQGPKTQANLKIQFDESIVGANPRPELKVGAQSTGGTTADSRWGLDDPTSLGDINCYALFVHGAEPEMRHSSCTNQKDTLLPFGPRAGFYSISEAGQIQVLAGKKRTIYIVGMRAAAGVSCPIGFDTNPDIESENFSNPFIIGQTTVDLTGGDNTISIPVKNSFTDFNKIKDCDFFEGDLVNQLVVTPPEYKRDIWIEDEINSRTVSFSHTGSTVQCSRDAGASFTLCDTDNSLVWLPQGYNLDHIIKVTYPDGTHKTYTLNPASLYPGLTLVPVASCEGNFSGNHGSASALSQYFTDSSGSNDSKFICFNDGANFTFASTALNTTAGAQSNTFIVRAGHTATISNTSDAGTLMISGTHFKFIGLTITGAGNSTNPAVKVLGSGTFEIQDGQVSNSGSAQAVLTTSGNATITHSQISNSLTSTPALYTSGGSASSTVKSSSISSSYAAVFVAGGGMVNIQSSELSAEGGSARAFDMFDDATLTISDSKIIDNSGVGSRLDAFNVGTVSTLALNGNIFVRTSDNGGMLGHSIDIATGGTGSNVINSADNDNIFCNELPTPSVPYFSGILTGTQDGGSFIASLNNGGQPLGQCH